MCKKVRDLVYSDRRIQVEEIAQALGISHGSVSIILHDRLGMRKLTARWVPKSLSDEQIATRASVCSALLIIFLKGLIKMKMKNKNKKKKKKKNDDI